MDPRVKLTRKVDGSQEIRIHEADLAELGQAGLVEAVRAHGLNPDDLGKPEYLKYRQRWVIPVRRAEDD